MSEIFVVKRDGKKELFDTKKIKLSIQFAVDSTEANPLELESKFDQFIKSGIKTSDIQDNIIHHAVALATPQTPEWISVAGRAFAMNMWSNFPLRDKTFREVVLYNIKKKEYTSDLLDYYSLEDLDELGTFINHEKDLKHSYGSLLTVSEKYLSKYELNQHMHMVNAMRFGQMEPKETRLEFVKDAYQIFSDRWLSLATPFMSNIRKGGNVASCFILSISDDLESIFDNIKRIAKISKNGGGLGVYLGNIRAKGSMVNGAPKASGTVVQWVKIINDTLTAVNQGGKRAGAGTPALPVWHNDILDFLDMQSEHGDPRLKAYDVFPQVCVPDLFMKRDELQQSWTTFCPFEVKQVLGIDISGKYGKDFDDAYAIIEAAAEAGKLKVTTKHKNARDITKKIMVAEFETGLPYIAFTDTMNAVNPNKYDTESEGIVCGNLCTESFSNVTSDVYGHVCNLASINLSNVLNFEDLARVSRLAAKVLDYGISLTNNPDGITKVHNDRYRTIGIGIMGLHDHLAYHFKNFGNLEYIKEIAECIEYNAVLASIEQAQKFGTFEAYDKSMWASGEMVQNFKKHSTGNYDWQLVDDLIAKHGIRNSQLTSPAPTTTTSIYQDCSASVLPVYRAFFIEDNKQGRMAVASKYLSKNPLGYGKTQSKFEAKEIIDVVAELQKFTDTGISMELIFDQNKESFTAKDLYDAIHYAHKKKIKTIYYIRSIKKNATLEAKDEACVSCAG